jgi:hypothetical protein
VTPLDVSTHGVSHLGTRNYEEGLIFMIDDGAKGIVEMLFCTSLLALVGAADQPKSSPRKLQIVNTKVIYLLTNDQAYDTNGCFRDNL